MNLLMLDNYDSFTYNIVQYLRELGATVTVARNDAINIDEVARLAPARIVISPGPSTPDNAGITLALIKRFAGQIPLLGICLGHQAIGQAFGGVVTRAQQVLHGKTSRLRHDGRGVFQALPQGFNVARYHSLAIARANLPAELEVTAESEDGEIMGARHLRYDVEGVQFHPESILSEHGRALLANFLRADHADHADHPKEQ